MKSEKCKMCGRTLQFGKDIRFQVTIEIKSCYDPIKISEEDLLEDHEEEIKDLIKKLSKMKKEDIEEEIYKKYTFHICLKCQKKYVKDPLFTNYFKIRLNHLNEN